MQTIEPKIAPNFSPLGKVIKDRYQIQQILNAGAFGQTYIALDLQKPECPQRLLKQIKLENREFLPTYQRLFTNEVQILQKLGYDNTTGEALNTHIPQLFDYFEENQELYLVQEFIPGHLLSDELPINKRCQKHWQEGQVIQLLQEILLILEFIHDRGIIHCDIKPDNIIRRAQDGKLILIDFGSAQSVSIVTPMYSLGEQNHYKINHTVCEIQSIDVVSSLGYIPPEQFIGQPQPNSDIYALGAIAIQALTGVTPGRLPLDRDTGELSWQQELISTISEKLTSVLTQMVRYNFHDRYQSATEVLQVIKDFHIPQDISTTSADKTLNLYTFSPNLLRVNLTGMSAFAQTEIEVSSGFSSEIFLQNFTSINPVIPSAIPTVMLENNQSETNLMLSAGVEAIASSSIVNESVALIDAEIPIIKEITTEIDNEITKEIAPENDLSKLIDTEPIDFQENLPQSDANLINLNISDNTDNNPIQNPIKPSLNLSPSATFLLGGISVGIAANVVAMAVGISTLLQVAPNDYGVEILAKANQQYHSGQYQEAIVLIQTIPDNSLVYTESQQIKHQWEQDWETAVNQYEAVETAVKQQRWFDVLKEARKAPEITFWQEKIAPIVAESKPNIEAQAEDIINQAYKLAKERDFTTAIRLLEQIPEGASVYDIVQPKINEYRDKQRIKAHRLIQAAYGKAAIGDFATALNLLEKLPKDMAEYDKIQTKIAEYRDKQRLKAKQLVQHAAQQAEAGNFIAALNTLEKIPEGTPGYEKVQLKIAKYRQYQRARAAIYR